MASNINPSIWGSAAWTFLRNIAKGYPDKPTPLDKERYRNYFELIGHVLPCEKCRANYKKHWIEVPITNYLGNKNQLYNWVNIIKSKTNNSPEIKSRFISERIQRIKESRINRARNARKKAGCGGCAARKKLRDQQKQNQ